MSTEDQALALVQAEQPSEEEVSQAAVPGRYKVVELSTVTDESLERMLNEWSNQGYDLSGMHFAMRETSRRPTMAFLVFTRRA